MHMRYLLAGAAALYSAAEPVSARSAENAVPALAWETCPGAQDGYASTQGMLCTTVDAPIDYSDPGAGSFSLAVIKAPARNPSGKAGTIFWNPGGPSDAGTEYLPALIGGFPARLRDRFDIVSWDPRGMGGRTTPVVQCFDSPGQEAVFLSAHLAGSLPTTPEELARDGAGRQAFNEACVKRNGSLLAHVSTADNARDLDLLRQAVGEETINYYGTSYGTFLGATYANMFPERVRSVVLDGAVAPVGWANVDPDDPMLSTFVRIGSDFAGARAIVEFMSECGAVGADACAFSAGSPQATREKWDALLARAKTGITLDGDLIDQPSLLAYVGASIYMVEPVPGFSRFPGWLAVAEFLQALWKTKDATAAGGGGHPANSAPPASDHPAVYATSAGRQLSVICGESPNPATLEAATAQAIASFARAGVSGWPFVASCVGWTARAKAPYLGPWNNATTSPVLVIGNTFDPATGLPSSIRMAEELGNARLLVVNGFGHTVLANPSRCAQDYVADYVIEGRLPPFGATCRQDQPPFPGG